MKRAIINALIDAAAPEPPIPVFVSSAGDILDLPVLGRRIPLGSSTLTQSIHPGISRSERCDLHDTSGYIFFMDHRRAYGAPLEVLSEI
jgi:hypothetical protein